jgi:hypothetical protein
MTHQHAAASASYYAREYSTPLCTDELYRAFMSMRAVPRETEDLMNGRIREVARLVVEAHQAREAAAAPQNI